MLEKEGSWKKKCTIAFFSFIVLFCFGVIFRDFFRLCTQESLLALLGGDYMGY